MKTFLLSLSWTPLVVAAIVLAILPVRPEPHLVQKTRWLVEGHPFRPIDVFDVFFHLAPTLLLIAKALAHWVSRP
jgi:hypothetical protein